MAMCCLQGLVVHALATLLATLNKVTPCGLTNINCGLAGLLSVPYNLQVLPSCDANTPAGDHPAGVS